VSRQVENGEIGFDEALAQLQAIERSQPLVNGPLLVLAAAASAAGFTGMFGGSAVDMLISGTVGALVELLAHLLARLKLQDVVSTLAGSLFSTLLPMVFAHLTGIGTVEPIVAGALMPLLPGLAMTNAVQDAMRGDMVSGLSHGLSAVLTAVLVAGGALVAAALMSLMGGAPV